MQQSAPIYVDFYDFLDDDDDDQDGGQDEEDADDVPCRTRGCRLADSRAQPWESSENCGEAPALETHKLHCIEKQNNVFLLIIQGTENHQTMLLFMLEALCNGTPRDKLHCIHTL